MDFLCYSGSIDDLEKDIIDYLKDSDPVTPKELNSDGIHRPHILVRLTMESLHSRGFISCHDHLDRDQRKYFIGKK